MSRRAAVATVLVLLAVAVAVVLVYAIVGDGDGGDDGTAGPTTTAPDLVVPGPIDPGLQGDGQELVDLLARRETATYHAVYSGTAPEGEEGGDVTLEVWRAGDLVRTDTRAGSGDQTAEAMTIASPDGIVGCNRLNGGEWACSENEGALDGDFGGVAAQLAGVEVVETGETEVDGRSARCFEFASPEGTGQVCTTPEGVILRLALGPTVLALTALDDVVSPADFVPPAPVE